MPKTIHHKLVMNFIFFLLIWIVGTHIIALIDKQRKNYSLDVQSRLIESRYKTNYKNFKVLTNEFAIMYQKNKQLINLLFKANNANEKESMAIRAQMYQLLYKNYNRLKQIGVSQVHFYLKNDKSFLRMYKTSKFGDDYLKLKSSVIRTNTTEPLQEGFKLSKYTNGLKFVYPIFDKFNQYIGGVEITYSTQQLMKNILDKSSYDAHILIAKRVVRDTFIEKELGVNYDQSWEAEDYLIESSTHKRARITNLYHTLKSKKTRDELCQKIEKNRLFSMHVSYHSTNIIITFLPLASDSQKKNDIYLVTYTESNYLSELIRENQYLLVLFLTFLIIIFLFTSYVLQSRDKFERLALYDNVTKLPNRTLFLIELQHELKRAGRYTNKVALLFIDLDGFKAVNDTYGHQIGDDLLRFCAISFSNDVRKSDIVARIGGDEFVIIITNIQNSEAVKIAKNIIKNINKPIKINNFDIKIGASIGISIYPDHAEDENLLIKIADNMMYESKNNGKNRVTIFSD